MKNSHTPQNPSQGAISNVEQRFSKLQMGENFHDILHDEEPEPSKVKTIKVYPKTIVNQSKGGNVPEFSMNPYQGCEHGCSYCYARPTHEFWSYNAGVDFERKILYKPTAPALLKKYFSKRNYLPKTITLSGNTDCYQPIESKLKITQQLLYTFLEHKHPVGIITKNALLLRDLEILKALAADHLVQVVMSINTTDEKVRRVMEPRTSTIKNRLKTIEVLSKHQIPVSVLVAPIIPALNSSEVIKVLKASSEAGAQSAGYTIIRLNDAVAPIFSDWLQVHFPDRADKVLNHIKGLYQGELGNLSTFQKRGGTGHMVESIKQSFAIGKAKFFPKEPLPPLNTSDFIPIVNGQLRLF